jgi:hypothetical protein
LDGGVIERRVSEVLRGPFRVHGETRGQIGGVGIRKHSVSGGSDLSAFYEELKEEGCPVEELIVQDGAIASFNPTSVNTIRAYSILGKSGVIGFEIPGWREIKKIDRGGGAGRARGEIRGVGHRH